LIALRTIFLCCAWRFPAGAGLQRLQPVQQTTNEMSKNTKFAKIGFSLRLKNAFPGGSFTDKKKTYMLFRKNPYLCRR
jgi:hypothetical protein